MAPKFTDLSTTQFNQTLAQTLVPTADSLRDMFTSFGLRPYKVRFVRLRWSGMKRGQGAAYVACEIDILPTPKILDLTTLTEIVNPVGLDEVGGVLLTQVSGNFTEEQLRFGETDKKSLAQNEEVFYEVQFVRKDDQPGDRRRFALRSAPMYLAGKFQWQLRLEKSNENRAANGDPRI